MSVTALVVDDSASARQIICYHLRLIGCSIAGEATNAADALELSNRLMPNIVTLDLMMPVKDNVDALALVRAVRKQSPNTAIIIVSQLSSQEQSFKEEGVFAYVTKPFNKQTLTSLGVKLSRAFPELTPGG
jgi:two-component system, chemotaxis family, chemotaxis protein CheY